MEWLRDKWWSMMAALVLLAVPTLADAQSAFSPSDFAPTERGGRLILQVSGEQDIELYKESYALIVGMSQYRAGWPKLPGVKEDTEAVAAALRKHGFRVGVVSDLTLPQLERVFTEFINRYGLEPQNRLLFYFAGHGQTLKMADGRTVGFLVPVDAPIPSPADPNPFMVHAMPLDTIETYAKRIASKHALFMFDACFAGTIFDTMRAAPPASIRYQVTRPVRQFITSGAAGETVPDHSIFRRQFIAALEGEGDMASDGYLTGEELGHYLQDTVINYSQGRQHPQYGKLHIAELDKGDFIFELPMRKAVAEVGIGHLSLNAIPEAVLLLNGHPTDGFPLIDEVVQAGEKKVSFKWADRIMEKKVVIRPGDNIGCTAFLKTGQIECRSRE